MKRLLALLALPLLAFTSAPPKVTPSPAPTTVAAIKQIADSSSCLTTNWTGRGHAPKAYVEGMALAYADALKAQGPAATETLAPLDTLAWYAPQLKAAGLDSAPKLRQLYTILIGLGMQESSGRYCCGRDQSATNETSETAEAGMFQESWNSRVFGDMAKFAANWKGDCREEFKVGIPCPAADLVNWGTGAGQDFQSKSKFCPGFEVAYTAALLRSNYKENGPLKTHASQVVASCAAMLEQVEHVQ